MSARVLVVCEHCRRQMGMKEVDEVRGEFLASCCPSCFVAHYPAREITPEQEAEWLALAASEAPLIVHPGQAKKLIDVNMEFVAGRGFICRIPREISAAAKERAVRNYHEYYSQMQKDLVARNHPAAEEIGPALEALARGQIRWVVDPVMARKIANERDGGIATVLKEGM